MLNRFILDFAKQSEVIYTLSTNAPNYIVSSSEKGIHVETNSSRNKFNEGKKNVPYVLIRSDWLEQALGILLNNRTVNEQDFVDLGRRQSFIIGFLSSLPFVEKLKDNQVHLRTFTTLDIPFSTVDQTMTMLQELINGEYTADSIAQNFKDDNMKRLKAHARQNLRLLGYLNKDNKLVNKDNSIQEVKNRILQIPFVHMIYKLLKFMYMYNSKEKLEVLREIAYLTVVSSTDQTTIKESVADRGIRNIFNWLKHAELIDGDGNVIEMTENVNRTRNYWWVNQGQTAKDEIEGGFLWAPKRNKQGTPLTHHTDLLKANPGDVVFAYSQGVIHSICEVMENAVTSKKPSTFTTDQWEEDGNLLRVQYSPLDPKLKKVSIPEDKRKQETGPFDVNGNVKQGYFFSVSKEFAEYLLSSFQESFPATFKLKRSTRKATNLSEKRLVNHIYNYIKNEGFYYKEEEVKSLYLSLRTKPFVILSGISGTGKTKIVEKFANSIGATEENGQFHLIPVRPDWSDGSELIGFEDIKGDFKPGPLTKVLLKAEKNPELPYFVLLDEMNLARVEYYFSDLLSVMESRKRLGDRIVTSQIPTPESFNQRVIIPDNVYIIGTVNMDETTHPFSSKVLDRANTMEFNEVDLSFFPNLQDHQEVEDYPVTNDVLQTKYLTLKDALTDHQSIIEHTTNWLIDINAILKKNKTHFGYRIRDEICFFMIYNQLGQLMTPREAFDRQLLQKVLPKINGSDFATAEIIEELFTYCTGQALDMEHYEQTIEHAHFPKSAEKLATMYNNQKQHGFTSFWLG
ncbi:AAA domain (dynein-related subfamily) [Halobacillus dabanensis]|uniref:AAA domain (Dynein-related subfamily) n=1 Tax=Halobacillus dabanensis TaxID=240302 RepID=A0A1I3QDL6_HALDA|nr:AAA family ATPase [Halobacillus dabanensis]SFJ31815.1 AAA domain (dynein-related subfamily) [Halobacillus dabanensis]